MGHLWASSRLFFFSQDHCFALIAFVQYLKIIVYYWSTFLVVLRQESRFVPLLCYGWKQLSIYRKPLVFKNIVNYVPALGEVLPSQKAYI